MWDHETIMMIVQGVGETLYMTVLSTVLGYLFGLPMGVLLAVSRIHGCHEKCQRLSLSTGELCRISILPVPQTNDLQKLCCPLSGLCLLFSFYIKWKTDIINH